MIIVWRTQFHIERLWKRVKAVVAAFNQEKALLGAFSVITNLRMELFEALIHTATHSTAGYFALHCSLARTLFAFSPIFADLE